MASEQKARSSYHHGDLKEALLQAAETILEQDGVAGPDAQGLRAAGGRFTCRHLSTTSKMLLSCWRKWLPGPSTG